VQFNAVCLEHIAHRGIAEVVTDVPDSSLNAIVAPCGMLFGEANNRIHDFVSYARATGLSLATGVELLRHEFPLPAEDRIWRDDSRQFLQSFAANGISLHRQSPTPIVVEQETLPAEPRSVRSETQ
jgi:hypothetical protein